MLSCRLCELHLQIFPSYANSFVVFRVCPLNLTAHITRPLNGAQNICYCAVFRGLLFTSYTAARMPAKPPGTFAVSVGLLALRPELAIIWRRELYDLIFAHNVSRDLSDMVELCPLFHS